MNGSRRCSKNLFSKIFMCYRDLPNFSVFLVPEDLHHMGQLVGVACSCLILQELHIFHLAAPVALLPIQGLEDDGAPLVPELPLHLVHEPQPPSKIESSMKVHLGSLNGDSP
jgi:hypothetical protein